MLAWHYQEADEPERTLPWLMRAGHYALKRYANTEAYEFFERAERLAPTGDDPAILQAARRDRHRQGPGRLVRSTSRRPAAHDGGDRTSRADRR